MSLFGANTTFKKAVARMKAEEQKKSDCSIESISSGIGEQMKIARDLEDSDGTATTSEIAQEGRKEYMGGQVVLPRDVFNEAVRMHNKEAVEHPSQIVSTVHGGSSVDDEGNLVYKQPRVYTIPSTRSGRQRSRSLDSQGLSRLSSPPPTTDYGGSGISFPAETPRATTVYEGSIVGFPPSAIPLDPFSTPRLSGSGGIIAQRYIHSEENINQNATEESDEEGMGETMKGSTPIPRKFEISDSEDKAMMEVEWRDEEPYMMPTKKGKKRNKGKGVRRPETPKRPIPNMPQTPSRKRLESDWAKPAGIMTNEKGGVNLEDFVGEYLRNTNGLRDFMTTNQLHDERYEEWCLKQEEHMAARQNHTDAGVASIRKTSKKIVTEVKLSREYDEERADKVDQRLEKIEKNVAKLAPVNMAKMIENAMSTCMEKMVDQLTERVVKRFEDMAEESRKKDEIRRGKQVEATPEDEEMSDIEFELGATFSEKEHEKVERAIRAEMEVDEQWLEQSRHASVIPPGGVRQEFPSLEAGTVTILKKKPVVPAVPQQKKQVAKKTGGKGGTKGTKDGRKEAGC